MASRLSEASRTPTAHRPAAVSAVDLTLSFGQRPVLRNISLDVQQGLVTALLGPTGSGETTLLRPFNRMNDKVAGEAVDELVTRHPVRVPDGQLYRSSPAEHLAALEGITGLGTRVDPMGAELTCHSHRASFRPVPTEITRALRIPPGEPACVLQLEWTSNGEPAATATTYLAAHLARQYPPAGWGAAAQAGCSLEPLSAPQAADGTQRADCRPVAITVELQPPLPSVAKRLRLAPGQPAFLVTVRFHEVRLARPRAVTAAALRPDMFRITLESVEPPGSIQV
jgi:energy-coupling factor transporter ATP-binding protein EcfA2